MNSLFVTCDKVGIPTGGGSVTHHEYRALMKMGAVTPFTDMPFPDPFQADEILCNQLDSLKPIDLAHFYAGTFTRTVKKLKTLGVKVTYSVVAHDKDISREEHERVGLKFNYPHLVEPALWQRYQGGYLEADIVFCPGTVPAEIVKRYGRTGRVEVIPHGCDIPSTPPRPLPENFTVGYLGAVGMDKGLIYLLHAWRRLDLPQEQGRLVLAGGQSTSSFVRALVACAYGGEDNLLQKGGCFGQEEVGYSTREGRAKICTLGWQDRISDFYDNVSVVVQPSATEGFGLEVLEAMAHGRPVLCSTGAGACDLVPGSWRFQARDVEGLVNKLRLARDITNAVKEDSQVHWLTQWKESALPYSWDNIEERYIKVWKELLG